MSRKRKHSDDSPSAAAVDTVAVDDKAARKKQKTEKAEKKEAKKQAKLEKKSKAQETETQASAAPVAPAPIQAAEQPTDAEPSKAERKAIKAAKKAEKLLAKQAKKAKSESKKAAKRVKASEPHSERDSLPLPTPAAASSPAAPTSESDSSDNEAATQSASPLAAPSVVAPDVSSFVHESRRTPAHAAAQPASTFARSSEKKPFQRVDPNMKHTLAAEMQDNSFSIERAGAFGARASASLIVTRGKGFRHQKTKHKRGNYKGGELDQGIRSIKFD